MRFSGQDLRYLFWRPITAIRNGDLDGNDATAPEADWTPLGDTPMHPEYPCAYCVASTTAGEQMGRSLAHYTVQNYLQPVSPSVSK